MNRTALAIFTIRHVQGKDVLAREKKSGKEMASASKLVSETVKRHAELSKQEAEVRTCACNQLYPSMCVYAPPRCLVRMPCSCSLCEREAKDTPSAVHLTHIFHVAAKLNVLLIKSARVSHICLSPICCLHWSTKESMCNSGT